MSSLFWAFFVLMNITNGFSTKSELVPAEVSAGVLALTSFDGRAVALYDRPLGRCVDLLLFVPYEGDKRVDIEPGNPQIGTKYHFVFQLQSGDSLAPFRSVDGEQAASRIRDNYRNRQGDSWERSHYEFNPVIHELAFTTLGPHSLWCRIVLNGRTGATAYVLRDVAMKFQLWQSVVEGWESVVFDPEALYDAIDGNKIPYRQRPASMYAGTDHFMLWKYVPENRRIALVDSIRGDWMRVMCYSRDAYWIRWRDAGGLLIDRKPEIHFIK